MNPEQRKEIRDRLDAATPKAGKPPLTLSVIKFERNAPSDIRALLEDNAALDAEVTRLEGERRANWVPCCECGCAIPPGHEEAVSQAPTAPAICHSCLDVVVLRGRLDVYRRAWKLATKTLGEHQVGSDGKVWDEVAVLEKQLLAEEAAARAATPQQEAKHG